MLDKVIHKHIDRIDAIEEAIDKEIDRLISGIDIDDVMANPEAVINEVMILVKGTIMEKYAKEAIDAGLQFAATIKNMIKQDKEIKVPKTKDPKLNEDIVE